MLSTHGFSATCVAKVGAFRDCLPMDMLFQTDVPIAHKLRRFPLNLMASDWPVFLAWHQKHTALRTPVARRMNSVYVPDWLCRLAAAFVSPTRRVSDGNANA